MPSGFNTRITKTTIPNVKATKGDDLWTKVKSKATESAVIAASSIASNGLSYQDSNGVTDEHQTGEQVLLATEIYPIKEFGENGEIILAYEDTVEIWDWTPSPTDDHVLGNSNGDTLFLISRTDKIKGSIKLVSPLSCNRSQNKYKILVGFEVANDYFFQIIEVEQKLKEKRANLVLLPSTIGSAPYHCKVLSKHFVLVTSEGSISMFNKNDCSPVSDLEVFCKIINGSPVCDVQGDWLIYNPSVQDPLYQKILLDSSGESLNITQLNLPKPGPLLNRVLKNLSSTAIDGVFKIAEISHSKLKKYMNLSNDDVSKSRNLRDTITKILNALNETSSKQILVLVSLKTRKPLFCFSPPGGCSTVSLSPYDLLLTTVTLRGDDIFIWDFTKYTKEISLIEKFKRGKTPGVVNQIIWYSQNKYIGVLSKLSGSLHWFQNNFLNEYDESDSWTFSSFGLKKLKLVDQNKILAFDNKNNLKVIDTKGTCNTSYIMPKSAIPVNLLPNYLIKDGSPLVRQVSEAPKDKIGKSDFNLELDYTLPYEFFYKNRKSEFYNKASEDLNDWFFKNDDQDLAKIDFGRANGVAVFHDNKESINMLLNE